MGKSITRSVSYVHLKQTKQISLLTMDVSFSFRFSPHVRIQKKTEQEKNRFFSLLSNS